MFFLTSLVLSQTPQYYNFNSGGTGNTIPFGSTGVSGYRSQWLMMPNAYNNPSPVPPGNKITKLYIRCTASAGPIICSSLKIRLGQTTDTVFQTSAYTGPMDSVYFKLSDTVSTNSSGYAVFTLQTPYNYNPALSLVIEISHCGFTGTGFSVYQYTALPNKRTNSPGTTSCVFTYSSTDARTIHSGVDVVPAGPTVTLPDLIYYKFENNPNATSTPNYAVPGVGNNPALLTGTSLSWTSGGQFDSCMIGTGGTGGHINTNWATNFGSGSWTISMWLSNLPSNTTLYYLFEEGTGSFRCFLGGAAGAGNLLLRGTGVTDVNVPGVAPGPTVVHFVYDSATAKIKAYKNGVLALTVNQTPLNLATGTNFQVGGYSTLASLNGKMDEFRVYRRALDSAEVASTWNIDLGGLITGVTPVTSKIPNKYVLEQNYPNPFNPVTKISFDLPKTGLVSLKVFDVLGKEVATLVNEVKNPGSYIVDFDGASLSSGTYFYRLESNGFVSTKKMMLIK